MVLGDQSGVLETFVLSTCKCSPHHLFPLVMWFHFDRPLLTEYISLCIMHSVYPVLTLKTALPYFYCVGLRSWHPSNLSLSWRYNQGMLRKIRTLNTVKHFPAGDWSCFLAAALVAHSFISFSLNSPQTQNVWLCIEALNVEKFVLFCQRKWQISFLSTAFVVCVQKRFGVRSYSQLIPLI